MFVPVVMDPTMVVSKSFQANNLPTTVFIDKRGIIREVLVGVSPNYAEELRSEIDALLAE